MHKEVSEVVRHQTCVLKESADGVEALTTRLDVLEKMIHTLSQHQNIMSPRLHTVAVSKLDLYHIRILCKYIHKSHIC